MTRHVPQPRTGRPPDPRRHDFEETYRRCHGNLTRTAKELGIARKTAGEWRHELDAGTLTAHLPPTTH